MTPHNSPPPTEATAAWLDAAPPAVRRLIGTNILMSNFLRDLRNKCFQMQGQYDGSISEECKALFAEQQQVCEAFVQASKRWRTS
jgi:hypothetical protein